MESQFDSQTNEDSMDIYDSIENYLNAEDFYNQPALLDQLYGLNRYQINSNKTNLSSLLNHKRISLEYFTRYASLSGLFIPPFEEPKQQLQQTRPYLNSMKQPHSYTLSSAKLPTQANTQKTIGEDFLSKLIAQQQQAMDKLNQLSTLDSLLHESPDAARKNNSSQQYHHPHQQQPNKVFIKYKWPADQAAATTTAVSATQITEPFESTIYPLKPTHSHSHSSSSSQILQQMSKLDLKFASIEEMFEQTTTQKNSNPSSQKQQQQRLNSKRKSAKTSIHVSLEQQQQQQHPAGVLTEPVAVPISSHRARDHHQFIAADLFETTNNNNYNNNNPTLPEFYSSSSLPTIPTIFPKKPQNHTTTLPYSSSFHNRMLINNTTHLDSNFKVTLSQKSDAAAAVERKNRGSTLLMDLSNQKLVANQDTTPNTSEEQVEPQNAMNGSSNTTLNHVSPAGFSSQKKTINGLINKFKSPKLSSITQSSSVSLSSFSQILLTDAFISGSALKPADPPFQQKQPQRYQKAKSIALCKTSTNFKTLITLSEEDPNANNNNGNIRPASSMKTIENDLKLNQIVTMKSNARISNSHLSKQHHSWKTKVSSVLSKSSSSSKASSEYPAALEQPEQFGAIPTNKTFQKHKQMVVNL